MLEVCESKGLVDVEGELYAVDLDILQPVISLFVNKSVICEGNGTWVPAPH